MARAHLTAIHRRNISAPMRWLGERGLLGEPSWRRLDYGCGHGHDADALGFTGFDPHWRPAPPIGRFELITCNYVLNVVDEAEGYAILRRLQALLTDDGIAYVTVRRDVKVDGVTSRGTYQRNVELPLRKVRETAAMCIYALRPWSALDSRGV